MEFKKKAEMTFEAGGGGYFYRDTVGGKQSYVLWVSECVFFFVCWFSFFCICFILWAPNKKSVLVGLS